MKIILDKRPDKPVVVEGFPGFGLIGTIATDFLIGHLKAEQIGRFEYDELPAMLAIHQGKLVHPMGVFYSKEHNIVLLHTILNTAGFEWKAANAILDMCKALDATEIISIEGVAGPTAETEKCKCYFFTQKEEKAKELSGLGITPLHESIIIGVTSALMLKFDIPVTCMFVHTFSQLPDSKAAAAIIEALDKYLSLRVDTEPLMRQAEAFEKKLKKIQEQTEFAAKEQELKRPPSYLG